MTAMNCFSSCNGPDLKTLASQSLKSLPEEKLNNAKLSYLHTVEELLQNVSSQDEDIEAINVMKFQRIFRSPGDFMKHEHNRLKSYHGEWPLKTIDPLDLANIGLFYCGPYDQVQCAFCQGCISRWEETDIPAQEHHKLFPTCPFLLGSDADNVPMTDKSGFLKWQVLYPYPPSVTAVRQLIHLVPKYPHMNHMGRRLETYHNWTSTILGKQQLAKCGLFYTGIGDTVTCFCCGIQLSDWEPGDDLWVEHAKQSLLCAYLKLVKGSRFIIETRQNMPCSLTPIFIDYGQIHGYCSTLQALQNGMSYGISQSAPVVNTSSTSSTQIQFQNGQHEEEWKYKCRICFGNEPRVVFMPCKHCHACRKCAENLVNCSLCQSRIENYFEIYID